MPPWGQREASCYLLLFLQWLKKIKSVIGFRQQNEKAFLKFIWSKPSCEELSLSHLSQFHPKPEFVHKLLCSFTFLKGSTSFKRWNSAVEIITYSVLDLDVNQQSAPQKGWPLKQAIQFYTTTKTFSSSSAHQVCFVL